MQSRLPWHLDLYGRSMMSGGPGHDREITALSTFPLYDLPNGTHRVDDRRPLRVCRESG